jgi:hypothetical protein
MISTPNDAFAAEFYYSIAQKENKILSTWSNQGFMVLCIQGM